MIDYIIYLLDLPETHCTSKELILKDKIINNDASFFDELKFDRPVSRLLIDEQKLTSLWNTPQPPPD